MKPRHIVPVLVSLLMCSCGLGSSRPNPQTSRYLKTEIGGVMMDSQTKTFRNSLTFTVRQGAPVQSHALVIFQPLDGTSRITPVVKDNLSPGQKVYATSSAFSRIRNNTTYDVTVQLYSDAAKTQLIDLLKQPVNCSMPPQILKGFDMASHVD